jgi:hypothetical protein
VQSRRNTWAKRSCMMLNLSVYTQKARSRTVLCRSAAARKHHQVHEQQARKPKGRMRAPLEKVVQDAIAWSYVHGLVR